MANDGSGATMKVHGYCHCGAITYEALVDPAHVTICHCTDCQQLTGTAYRVSVPTRVDDFHLLSGTPKVYMKVGDSGGRRAQAFCADCGSPLYAGAAEQPRTYGLRVGCLEERNSLPARKRIWCASALPWSMDLRDLPGDPREPVQRAT